MMLINTENFSKKKFQKFKTKLNILLKKISNICFIFVFLFIWNIFSKYNGIKKSNSTFLNKSLFLQVKLSTIFLTRSYNCQCAVIFMHIVVPNFSPTPLPHLFLLNTLYTWQNTLSRTPNLHNTFQKYTYLHMCRCLQCCHGSFLQFLFVKINYFVLIIKKGKY